MVAQPRRFRNESIRLYSYNYIIAEFHGGNTTSASELFTSTHRCETVANRRSLLALSLSRLSSRALGIPAKMGDKNSAADVILRQMAEGLNALGVDAPSGSTWATLLESKLSLKRKERESDIELDTSKEGNSEDAPPPESETSPPAQKESAKKRGEKRGENKCSKKQGKTRAIFARPSLGAQFVCVCVCVCVCSKRTREYARPHCSWQEASGAQ